MHHLASSTTRSTPPRATSPGRGWPVQRLATPAAMALLMAALLFVGLAGCGTSQSHQGTAAASPSAIPSATASPTPNPAALIPGWTLIWWDEFDGTSLDATKWTVVSDAPGGYQHCCLRNTLNAWAPDDISLVNGSLRLTTERRSFQGHAYTSGALATKGKFDFLHGRVDIRARLPKGNGLWPAFWLLPSDFQGSGYAPYEVDVAEALGQWPHTDFMVAWVGSQRTGYCEDDGPDFTAGYHVFTFIWTATAITWQIDGTQRCSFTTGVPTARMELVLSTSIGGSWPVPPDASTVLPQYTDLDYVRVYAPATP
ncbi:MAG TPA: glycoside hydrolase family 16 protein [Ktedonobacterales bacterium]